MRWVLVSAGVAVVVAVACRGVDGPHATPQPRSPLTVGAVTLPADYRSCGSDEDCVVAPSLAGLDRLPGPGDTCQGTCYVGVRATALRAWERAVEALAASVPCTKEFEPCPPRTHWRAACVRGTCQAIHVGPPRPSGPDPRPASTD